MLKKTIKRLVRVNKRMRFVISSLLMTSLMLISTFYSNDKIFFFIPLFVLSSYLFTYFSIIEGLRGIEWFTLFIVPATLTLTIYLFYLLIPTRWLTRLPFVLIYEVLIYASLLTSNIFNVGVKKNLKLYRAAFSVNFLFQVIMIFLFATLVFALKLDFILNALILTVFVFILSGQFFWSVNPLEYLESKVFKLSFFIALVIGELVIIFSFLPIQSLIFTLLVSSVYYSLAGLFYLYLDDRLFKERIREYLVVLVFIFIIVLLSLPS